MCIYVATAFLYCIVLSLLGMISLDVATVLYLWTRFDDIKWAMVLAKNKYFHGIRACMQLDNKIQPTPYLTWCKRFKTDKRMSDNLGRISKLEEIVYMSCIIILVIITLVIYILPFSCKLRIKFRKRIVKLAVIYLFQCLVCIVSSSMEISSVLATDASYLQYEDLANSGDEGAVMIASCQRSPTLYHQEIKHRQLEKTRENLFVCQDYWKKLLSALLALLSGVLYLIVACILFFQYRYLVQNEVTFEEERQTRAQEKYEQNVIQNNETKDTDYLKQWKRQKLKGTNETTTTN